MGKCCLDEPTENHGDWEPLQIGHVSSRLHPWFIKNGGQSFQSQGQFHKQHKWRNYAWLVSLPINLNVFQNNPTAENGPKWLANALRRNLVFSYCDIWREVMDFRALQLYWVFCLFCFILLFWTLLILK